MAEERPPSKIAGWFKAGLTSVLGLCSGAVLMYVSPLVNSAIKPAKPVANFGPQVHGLTVTFQNRSTGAADGTWDFGDGSLIEAYSPNQESVSHTYEHAGNYNVKLSLRNFIGEENDRTVAVNLDGTSANPPVIEAFTVVPVSADVTAPATFHVVSQIKNADMCIWSLGDDRPLEVSTDTSPAQQRFVTIKDAGFYTLRLVAVKGKDTAEKSESVWVNVGDNAVPVATLHVTHQAVQVHRHTREVNVHVAFPADRKDNAYPFSVAHGEPGYQIIDAKFARPVSAPGVKNANLAVAPDKSKVVLTGELVKPSGIMAWQKNRPPLQWTPTLVLTLERRSQPIVKPSDPITATLNLPGSTVIPLPKLSGGWEVKGTTMSLELREGPKVVFKEDKLPNGDVVRIKNHPYRVTATPGPDNVRLELIDARATFGPLGS
jgi:PKD repeat protein